MAGVVRGIGIDTVEVRRMIRLVERFGQRFLDRLFCQAEQDRGRGGPGWYASLAGRFAAKEAVLKAVGTGLRGCSWRDIEIQWDSFGKPSVSLHGRLAKTAAERGIGMVNISITHGGGHAMAVAIALEQGDGHSLEGGGR